MPRILTLMGSGENSPVMVTPHQNIVKRFSKDAVRINLDTPYGFQENADELTKKIQSYFEVNVGAPITEARLRRTDESTELIDSANWLFSGPGSPTYALRVWKATGASEALHRLIERGAVVMASAAAMTLGSKVMPVYEMYKAGEDPYWLEGINLLQAATGIDAAVVAHYNNTQGGTHDTRFCFIGEKRMQNLESQLGISAILGIDEHTGITFDLDSGTAEVYGKGVVTLKRGDEVRKISPKEIVKTASLI